MVATTNTPQLSRYVREKIESVRVQLRADPNLEILNSRDITDAKLSPFAKSGDLRYLELVAAHRNSSPATVEMAVSSALGSEDVLGKMHVFYEAIKSGKTGHEIDKVIEASLEKIASSPDNISTTVRSRVYEEVRTVLLEKLGLLAARR
jgi:hypothetical protein